MAEEDQPYRPVTEVAPPEGTVLYKPGPVAFGVRLMKQGDFSPIHGIEEIKTMIVFGPGDIRVHSLREGFSATELDDVGTRTLEYLRTQFRRQLLLDHMEAIRQWEERNVQLERFDAEVNMDTPPDQASPPPGMKVEDIQTKLDQIDGEATIVGASLRDMGIAAIDLEAPNSTRLPKGSGNFFKLAPEEGGSPASPTAAATPTAGGTTGEA